jgi:hypothetical protein
MNQLILKSNKHILSIRKSKQKSFKIIKNNKLNKKTVFKPNKLIKMTRKTLISDRTLKILK